MASNNRREIQISFQTRAARQEVFCLSDRFEPFGQCQAVRSRSIFRIESLGQKTHRDNELKACRENRIPPGQVETATRVPIGLACDPLQLLGTVIGAGWRHGFCFCRSIFRFRRDCW